MASRHARRPPVPQHDSVASLKGDPNARKTEAQKLRRNIILPSSLLLRDPVKQLQGFVSQRTVTLEDKDDNSILRDLVVRRDKLQLLCHPRLRRRQFDLVRVWLSSDVCHRGVDDELRRPGQGVEPPVAAAFRVNVDAVGNGGLRRLRHTLVVGLVQRLNRHRDARVTERVCECDVHLLVPVGRLAHHAGVPDERVAPVDVHLLPTLGAGAWLDERDA